VADFNAIEPEGGHFSQVCLRQFRKAWVGHGCESAGAVNERCCFSESDFKTPGGDRTVVVKKSVKCVLSSAAVAVLDQDASEVRASEVCFSGEGKHLVECDWKAEFLDVAHHGFHAHQTLALEVGAKVGERGVGRIDEVAQNVDFTLLPSN
jgi:hypothetical protein